MCNSIVSLYQKIKKQYQSSILTNFPICSLFVLGKQAQFQQNSIKWIEYHSIQLLSNNMNLQEQHQSRQEPAQPSNSASSSSSSSSSPRSSENYRNGRIPRPKSASSQQQGRMSRSRSRDRKKNLNGRQNQRASNSLLENYEQKQDRIKQDQSKQLAEHLKLNKNASKVGNVKEDKNKKKKVQRQYLTDFTQFLPQALLVISRTNVTSKIRIGQRYQANIPTQPRYSSQIRSLQEWKIWNGSSYPQNKPSAQHLWRFKQLLGQNRNEEELISMRMRIGNKSWREVLQYVGNNKAELRRVFHNAQRNRLI